MHLGALLLLQTLGASAKAAEHVAYKGGAEAALAVLSHNVDFSCGNLTSEVSLIQGGKLRALFVTTPERVKDIPDVPTVRELGYPQLESLVGWSALYGPRNMDPAALAKWTEVLSKISKDIEWLASEGKIGSIPRILSPQDTESFVSGQVKLYERLIGQLGLEIK